MKFKVGDKVRLTWDTLYDYVAREKALWTGETLTVLQIAGDNIFVSNEDGNREDWQESQLELVPEEPEFEYGEEVEVWDWSSEKWYKRIFISKIPGNAGNAYACVVKNKEENFKSGKTFEVNLRKTVRKLKPQLTRREIAEKFGVSEDFILVD